MTTNLFEHTPVPYNSSISPVENLATELTEAFDRLESIIISTNVIPSFSKIIGDYLLLDVNYHGFEEDLTETVSITDSSNDIVLNSDVLNILSVSYLDRDSNEIKYLEEKFPSQEFTKTSQYKVLGKVIHLSGTLNADTVKVTYRGVKKEFGNLKLKPNVITNKDGEYLLPLEVVQGLECSVDFEHDLPSNIEKYFGDVVLPSDRINLMIKTLDGFKRVPFNSVVLNGTKIIFNTVEPLDDTYQSVVYVNNITISDFLESFYKEFTSHGHSKDGNEELISHKNLVDLYKNNNTIFYKDIDIVNYEHPQYLNREGYNPTLTSVYENALLGDLLLSSKISEKDQDYKTLLKNSNSIMFGDPIRGTRILYDSTKEALTILAGNGLNGLELTVGLDKKALSINEDSFIKETADVLQIRGKNDTVSFIGTAGPSTVKTENIVNESNFKTNTAVAEELVIGNASFINKDKNVEVNLKDDTSKNTISVKVPTHFDSVSSSELSTKNLKLRDEDKISIDDDNYITKGESGFDLITDQFRIQSSGRRSGIVLGTSKTLEANLYTADYLGQKATLNDSSLYLEPPKGSDIYLLKNTDYSFTYGDKEYVFGSVVAGKETVTNLKAWRKADFHSGDTSSYMLTLDTTDTVRKNGLRIGRTRLSVIGEGTDCPEGMTVLESLSTVHFISPLPENEVRCSDLTYQSVNTGDLQIFGNVNVQNSAYIVDNLVVGERTTTSNLSVSTEISTQDLTVRGITNLNGETVISGSVAINNKVTITGETKINGSVKVFDLTTDNFLKVAGTLTVDGQTLLNNNLIVDGKINTAGGFTTNGPIESDSLRTGPITCETIKTVGGLISDGEVILTGPVTVHGSFSMNGNAIIHGALETVSELTAKSSYITTNSVIDGRLTVGGSTLLTDSVTVGKNLSVQEGIYTPSSIESKSIITTEITAQTVRATMSLKADGGIVSTGPVDLNGGLSLKGNATIVGSASVTEDLSVRSLNVLNNVDINNRLTVQGAVYLESSSIQIGKRDSSTTIIGNLQLDTPFLTLTGSMRVYEELEVSGDVNLAGKLTVSEEIQGTSAIINTVKVVGTLTAEVAEFSRRVLFGDGLRATGEIEATRLRGLESNLGSATATDLYVATALTMGSGSTVKVETLIADSITQTSPLNEVKIAGRVILANDIVSQGEIVLGEESIKWSDEATGAYLAPGKLKLGRNSIIAGTQISAGQGTPLSGAKGYTFGEMTNTGLYGTILTAQTSGEALNLYINGTNKAWVGKEDIGLSNGAQYDKHIITLDVLKTAISDLRESLHIDPNALVEKCYPINSIYITMDSRSPEVIFGFGTWMRFSAGRTLVGVVNEAEVGGSIAGGLEAPATLLVTQAGTISGEYEVGLTADNNGPHTHRYNGHSGGGGKHRSGSGEGSGWGMATSESGIGKPHNNIQPSTMVNIWRRIG